MVAGHTAIFGSSQPEWRNGKRTGLKIRRAQALVSSSLTSGISLQDNELRGIDELGLRQCFSPVFFRWLLHKAAHGLDLLRGQMRFPVVVVRSA